MNMGQGPEDLRGKLRKIGTGLRLNPDGDSKLEARSYPDLVAKYKLFKNSVGFDAGIVYHPCGAVDVSPSEAFSRSRVIYADIDDKTMEALRAAGYEAHTADATRFDPGPVDVLVLLNPQIEPNTPSSSLKEGGYVISNNYHATADRLKKLGFTPVGVIVGQDGDLTFDTNHLEEYWEEVESDDEFRKVNEYLFLDASRVVEKITGQKNDILQQYKNIIIEVRKGTLPGVSNISDIQVAVRFDYKGEIIVMPARLPRKKGTVDDMFVFRKEMHE